MEGSRKSVQHQVRAIDHFERLFAVAALSTSNPPETSCNSITRAEFLFVFHHQNAFLHRCWWGRRYRLPTVLFASSPRSYTAARTSIGKCTRKCCLFPVRSPPLYYRRVRRRFGNDGQPEANALRLGGEEWIENAVALGGIDAAAAVDHRDFRIGSGGGGFSTVTAPPGGLGLRGVISRL